MRFALSLLVLFVPGLGVAQEPPAVETETFVPTTPISRSNPDYPTRPAFTFVEHPAGTPGTPLARTKNDSG